MVQKSLFPIQQDINNKRIQIGKGYTLEWIAERLLTVYKNGVHYKTIEIKAGIDKRVLVVELILDVGVIKSRLADALNISRQSIDNWIDTFKKAGFEGLVNSHKGSKESGQEENGKKIPQGNKARQLEEDRRRERETLHKAQLSITIDASSTGGEQEEDLFNERYGYQKNRYSGSFIYWAIFQHIFGFMGLCKSLVERYSVVLYLFALMLTQGIESVGQLEGVFKREFGKVIGIKQLWNKPRLWRMVHEICGFRKSKDLIEGFFHRQANNIVSLYWLYIDGNFIPFNGNEHMHNEYYMQQDHMIAGQTQIFVHDCHGQIVYFHIQEGKGDLEGMIRTMSEKWSAYIGGTPPLIIVDQEAFGVEHFLSLQGYRFVTWEKLSTAEELSSIPDNAFDSVFLLNEKEYQAYENQKSYKDDMGNSIELRRIVIWDKTTGKRIACVTQDKLEDTQTIATAILSRCGCSENSFRGMCECFNMHYNPVVEVFGERKKQEVAHPDHKRLKNVVSQLKTKLAKCKRELRKMPINIKKDGSLRKNSKWEKLQHKQAQLKQELAEVKEKLKKTPQKVRLDRISSGDTFKELNTEGKNLWILAQCLVWNSRKKLIGIFKELLPTPLDSITALDAITHSKGWIKSTRESLEVRLEPLAIPRFKAAQIQLCRALNEKEIRLNNGKRLFFDVGFAPEKISQKSNPKCDSS